MGKQQKDPGKIEAKGELNYERLPKKKSENSLTD